MANNTNEGLTHLLSQDVIASELATALDGLFHVSSYKKVHKYGADYTTLFCKPTDAIGKALLIERQVLALVANFPDIHARTITVCQEVIDATAPQLDPRVAIILHADKAGDQKLRAWGREQGMTVIPIHRPKGGAIPPSAEVRQRLARELFASDPFAVTGPVTEDIDFFGRRNEAIELVRQLQQGRIRSLFGVRKAGKTSLINRVIALARDAGTPRVAMVDCSLKAFYQLSADEALQAVAKVCKMAATRGYAHVSDALKVTERVPDFSEWLKEQKTPLVLIFDEIDYITPDSVPGAHWRDEFVDFWRDLRVFVQEAQRHSVPVALLVCGVSSRCFRQERIGEVENPVLHFVPDNYLAPFERGASESMLRDLGKRCGLQWTEEAKTAIAEACGDFPFWMRMACSYIHRNTTIESRPALVGIESVRPLIDQFIAVEGIEIAKLAAENLRRVYPETYLMLEACIDKGPLPIEEVGQLLRYGLAKQTGLEASVRSAMIKAGVQLLRRQPPAPPAAQAPADAIRIALESDSEWAEELASLNKRRNLLERRLRELIRFTLKAEGKKDGTWVERVLKSLPQERRAQVQDLAADLVMPNLYWKDLGKVVEKYWSSFEPTFGDKNRLVTAMDLVNARPDTHAKDVDLADLALQRRELQWLEERILN